MNTPSPMRRLRAHSDIHQLRRQAKELLASYRSGDEAASTEVRLHYHDASPSTFALHDAQLVIARAYGFQSWPKLKAHVDGVTVERLCEAVRAGNITEVRAMLDVRPELANMELPDDGHRPLHYAVYNRSAEMVRVLMEKGADARKEIWPHRDATSAFIVASERGYDELVEIILEQERRHPSPSRTSDPPAELLAAAQARDEAGMIAFLEKNPEFINLPHDGLAPLHFAAAMLLERLLLWLLDHGANVNLRERNGPSPLELIGRFSPSDSQAISRIVSILLSRGAEMTPRAAIALGDADWIRARHAEGTRLNSRLLETAVHHRRTEMLELLLEFGVALTPRLAVSLGKMEWLGEHDAEVKSETGLLSHAVRQNVPEIVSLLLDLGLDPNEPREGSAGGPLRECAKPGRLHIAKMLLDRGANPNAHGIYEWSALYEAYTEKNPEMIQLLTSHGGYLNAAEAGYTRQVEIARKMLVGEVDSHYEDSSYSGKTTVEQLLNSGANAGDPEIVRMTLAYIDWPRDDPRWLSALSKILPDQARWNEEQCERYVAAFRLILDRCNPNLRSNHGRTILHDVIAADFGDGVALATILLDAGARIDVRDNLLQSTPLGWACRWGRLEIVKLLLEHGADPVEADAETWASPRAWAERMKRDDVLSILRTIMTQA